MSEEKLDPDVKINMSLDQIIRLDKSLHHVSRRKWRRKRNLSVENHSVPLLSSLGGGFIYVSKTSPLLYERKRRLREAQQNRLLNSGLLKKKVIPASYHLIKTDTGFEKVLLPIRCNTVRRKRTKKKKDQSSGKNFDSEFSSKEVNQSSTNDSDDEIVVLYSSIKTKAEGGKMEPMDVETHSFNSSSEWPNVHCNYFVPQRPLNKTLNDRFRLISSDTGLSTTSSDFHI